MRQLLTALFLLTSLYFFAQDTTRLRIGVVDNAPYAMQDDQGNWTGLGVTLWQRIAERVDLTYDLKMVAPQDSLLPLVGKEVDVLLVAPVTPNGTAEVDYLYPYHQTTLGVASPQRSDMWQVAKNIFSFQFLQIIMYLSVILMVVGTLVYFMERKKNEEQFGGDRSMAEGIGSGFWWAGVTLTTIGYGDKAPTTLGGRIVAMLWMLTALAITASLTAAVVSALNRGSTVSFPDDLREQRVGTTEQTKAIDYLQSREIDARSFPDAATGLQRLQNGELDYFIDNTTSLRYIASQNSSLTADVQATDTRPQAFAIAVDQDSPLRDSLAAANVAVILSGSWRQTLSQYGISAGGDGGSEE